MPHPRPITYDKCEVCESLREKGFPKPIVGQFIPQATINDIKSARFHNWYFFTLGYSPQFVDYVIKKKKIAKNQRILDPFLGSGTTIVEAKSQTIPSVGIDANDFMVFASKVKTNWDLDTKNLETIRKIIIQNSNKKIARLSSSGNQRIIDNFIEQIKIYEPELTEELVDLIERRYISKKPLEKVIIIQEELESISDQEMKDFFSLALYSILVPASNVKFGPGFGIGPIKNDSEVIDLYRKKTLKMIEDLEFSTTKQKKTPTEVYLGDSRRLTEMLDEDSIDHMITSPPYPGDHEYTRHTRLELVISGMAKSKLEIRGIKDRMVRCSTRSVYKTDDESKEIKKFPQIIEIMKHIDRRVIETNGTSGFEKLYSKVVGEYFGGMYRFLKELNQVLCPSGTAAFLVGDSHAFKMKHIETAKLLAEMAKEIGFSSYDLELWWNKRSTSHSFFLPEYILNLTK